MNATQQVPCTCNTCPDTGCQQATAQTTCDCGPECQCGAQCQCGSGTSCAQS